MSAPSIQTLGDLRRATVDMPDDVRVVVDGHEDGYEDVSLVHCEGARALCLTRFGDEFADDDPQVLALADLRTKPALLAEALSELHAIVGDDIDPAETLAELREPSGHLFAGVEALRAEVASLTAERDRLARILAVERGDATAAPAGWRRDVNHQWYRNDGRHCLTVYEWGGVYTWELSTAATGTYVCNGRKKYALEAMEAASTAAGEPTP
jgi:hypothetical protein